ncbi:6-phosphogluconolactonase [Lutibacter oricola]|uniref:6-phosphogluconolactonase n=1 Tax=Lutibacter oricola TaxID=762486 RepID=A0A1H2QUU8_9FLAO|nr:lactonase family protein [Lutibacter oricola]SDW10933.1 6-phosphogluconolactonase [Lutibacter oricola]
MIKKTLLAISLLVSIQVFTQNNTLYVGSYTKNTESEGIYTYSFNQKTGVLNNKKLIAKTVNPSYLAISKNKKLLYTVSENGKDGVVKAYNITKKGKLNFINEVNSNGAGPCHVEINKSTNKVVTSNYGGGTVSIYNVNKNGSLNEAFQVIDHNIKEDKARAHSAQFLKNNLFIADLGRDFLSHYIKKNNNYVLKKQHLMKNGAGPRHFEISKKGKFIYVINELNSTVTVLKNDGGNYKNVQSIGTLKHGYIGKNSCADIHLSKNGKYLYGSNRGENSIVVFKVDKKTGKLLKIQNISVEGNWPRNFKLSPNGKFMLVANQKSNNISVFKVDKTSGKLTYKNSYNTPSPVCLKF